MYKMGDYIKRVFRWGGFNMKRKRYHILLFLVPLMFLTGCLFTGSSLDVTVDIPFLNDTPLSVVLVASRRDGQRVAAPMKKKDTIYTGRLSRLEPGEWSLSVDFEYKEIVVGSETLVSKINVGKERKSLKFALNLKLSEDPNLIGPIEVPAISQVGDRVILKESRPGLANKINWRLVYKPYGSLSQFTESENEASLICDKEGQYIVEAYVKTATAYSIQYIFINSANSFEYLSYSAKKAEYSNGIIYLLTKDQELLSINSEGIKPLAVGEKIDSFVIDATGSRAAFVCNNSLLLWDLVNDREIQRFDLDDSVVTVHLLHDDFIVFQVNDQLRSLSIKDGELQNLFYKADSVAMLPESQVFASVGKGVESRLYIWDKIQGVMISGASDYSSNSDFDNVYIWGLSQGRFLESSGRVLWVDSDIKKLRPANQNIIRDDEQIQCLERDQGKVIFAKKSPMFSELVIASESNLQTEYEMDLPTIKTETGIWEGALPLACGYLNDKIVALVSVPDKDEVALVYYSR